jgi:hypothetical protein
MKAIFLKFFSLLGFVILSASASFAKFPTHSVMPYMGIANTGVTNYTLRVSHGLQVSYNSGDRLRTPVGLRYQYRMKKGNIFGADFFSIYNPLIITPQYLDANSVFGGPAMTSAQNMLGADIHFSKTIDIKIIEVFGMAGIGGYLSNKAGIDMSSDFSWYKGASTEFYDFAPLVCNNSLKSFMPLVTFGAGVRFKHLEAGLNNQMSLASPVNSFTYNGFKHSVPLSWKSIGYYVGYRFEF